MNNIYHLTAVILLLSNFSAHHVDAQCPTGNVILSEQSDVNNFISTYPNCTLLPGDLTISSTAPNYITDLTSLSQITAVTGTLFIPSIHNDLSLDGLENIQSARSLIIGLEIVPTPQLWYTNLAALGNISGHLDSLFIGNMSAANIGTDFPNIISIGYLRLANNNSLTSIPAFPALALARDITVFHCQALEHLIFPENIYSIDFYPDQEPGDPFYSGIYIQENAALQTIACNSNFGKLNEVIITENDQLESIIGFESVDSIAYLIQISGKQPTIFDSFHNLSYIRSAALTMDDAELSEPFSDMFINFGENASTVEIGSGGLTINASMVSSLWVTGPIVSSMGNIQLTGNFHTLNGLGYLQEIGGSLNFICPDLTQLPDMPQLSIINGNLTFLGTENSLVNFEGLNGLSSINGDFKFGFVSPVGNYALQSLDGLEMLTEVGQSLLFRNLPSLSDIQALGNLTSVGSVFHLRNLPMLSNEGVNLPNFSSAGGIHIENTGFTEVPEMPVFTSSNGNIRLVNNPGLTNTSGFENLLSLNGDLFIDNNPMLSELNFNGALDFSGQFTLTNNPEMSTCDSPTVCMFIDLSSEDIIENNGTNCNSINEVLAGCLVNTSDVETLDWKCFQIHSGHLIINSDRLLSQARISLYDLQGKRQFEMQIKISDGNNTFTIPQLASGVYLLQISTNDQTVSNKIWLQ